MGERSAIEWCDATWNVLRGCSRVSEGCRNCYAERQAARQAAVRGAYHGLVEPATYRRGPRWTGEVRLVEEALSLPLRWRRPRRIFVNSMSDLFHERVPDEWIDRIFAVMGRARQHTFQVLTKRAERMRAWARNAIVPHADCDGFGCSICDASLGRVPWSVAPAPNVWLGVSVENQPAADERIPLLLQTPAAVRFLSVEPLLGPVDLSKWLTCACAEFWPGQGCHPECPTRNLHWVIVGGESGPGARPCDLARVRTIVAQCRAAGVPVFVKQLGTRPMIDLGDGHRDEARIRPLRLSDRKGGDMAEWPEDLRVREWPR